MNILLKPDSSLPIYEQLVQAFKESMLNGELSPGDMLPSIRSLAKDLEISVITTKRAYEELESENLIYSQPGKGFFVKQVDFYSAGRTACSTGTCTLFLYRRCKKTVSFFR